MQPNEVTKKRGCNYCGTCCRKGGPALHLEDKALVDSGAIALKDLFTIRKGEPAFDNIAGEISPATGDIIKIKNRDNNDAACIYYDDNLGCTIYADRPLECRLLECWNTAPIENCYQRNRLDREHLLSGKTQLYDLVAAHQRRCDYSLVGRLAEEIRTGQTAETASEELMEMIRYDLSIRQILTEQAAGLSEEVFLFLFGRPLRQTIGLFGLRFIRKEGGVLIGC